MLPSYKNMDIRITEISELMEFVRRAQRVDDEVLVKRGPYTVSGSSLMGIMSIDTSQGMTVVYPEDATDFEVWITRFKRG